MKADPVDVAVVLPAGERFSPVAAGAIALLVHRTARQPSPYTSLVVGADCPKPFTDVPFLGVADSRLPLRAAWRYAIAIKSKLPRPRLIEVHNRADIAVGLSHLFPSVPVTLFCHNDPLAMRGLRGTRSRVRTLARLRGVAAVSGFIAGRLKSVAPATEIRVIPNGIDRVAQVPPMRMRENLILFVGRVVRDKGADAFVAACAEALPRLPGWRAEILGADRFGADSPETEFLSRLRHQAGAAGIGMPGFQPHPAVMAAMLRAAIIAVPSRWDEPFGLTALEAMASGAALVSTSRGGLAELVANVAAPCDPEDAPGFAATLRRLAENPDLRENLAQAGMARAADYTTEHMADRLWAWRAGVLNRHDQEAR